MNKWVGKKVKTKVSVGNIPAGTIGKVSYMSTCNLYIMFKNFNEGKWYSLNELIV